MQRKKKGKRLCRPVTYARSSLKKCKSAKVISELHKLNKQKDRITQDSSLSVTERAERLCVIDHDIQELGGVEFYQHLSKSAELQHGNFNSSKWVVAQLKSVGLIPRQTQGEKISLLDVGALDLNYHSRGRHIECTAIDLNPQKSGIQQADFLTFQATEICLYDVVVLSLVINFEGNISKRGDMLRCAHRLCKASGYVVVVLPLACLRNSRYMSHDHFDAMMTSLGFDLITSHDSQKLSFKMFIKTNRVPDNKKYTKQQLRNGPKMNNFSIRIT